MSDETNHLPPPLDLSRWRKAPVILMIVGGILCVAGLVISLIHGRNPQTGALGGTEFGYAWLLAFMFYLTVTLGCLFWVTVHHLTDAGWSVAIRRFCEHIGSLLFPWMVILFIPVILLAPKIYHWMTLPV